MSGTGNRGGFGGGAPRRGGGGGYGGENRGGSRGGRGAPRGGGSYPLRQLQKSTRVVDEKFADNFPKNSKWIDAEAAPASFKPPRCQGIGTLKQKTLQIETNHVGIQINFPDRIYHYEIVVKYGEKAKDARPADQEIKPKLWQKVVKAGLKLIEERHDLLSGKRIAIASDYSKALYTDKLLLGIHENYVVSASELDSTNTFVISVNETKSIIETKWLSKIINNMRGQEVLNIAEIEQIYNIVLKTLPLNRFVNVGRAGFFNPLGIEGFHLGGGLVNVAGFSLICTFGWKPFLNVDVANSVFVKGGTVMELLTKLFQEERFRSDPSNVNSWDSNVAARATELLKGCQVTYIFNGKSTTRRVTEVLQRSPIQQQFNVEGKQTNVSAYFLSKGLKLELANGPCLVLGNNQSTVPAEICKVERGHHYSKRLTERQTAAMITDTARPPVERKKRIVDSIKSCKFELDRVLKEFGVVRFGEGKPDQLLSFDNCRIIPAPSIHYGKNGETQIFPTNGVWNIWDYDFKFVDGAQVERWQILNLTGRSIVQDDSDLQRFVDQFTKMANNAGLKLPNYSGMESLDFRNSRSFDSGLADYFQKLHHAGLFQKKAFVLVIIPSKNHACYGRVKKLAELDTGILTQCVAEVNIRKCQNATVGNIILKLNAKLGGIDHFVDMSAAFNSTQSPIDFLTCPTLFIGADVTHPAANSLMPSVAAVTACYDRYGMKYCMHPQVQKRADKNAAEVIENLDVIVSKMLNNFKFVTKAIPRKIIYFRDGVGDGQYAEVLEKELGALRKACYMASGSTTYMPQITFISVQKRHKTRFFVKNFTDGIGKSGNCPPGAVIDTEIVHPTEMDFYLLSHQGIQGTSRPTRYHLLWDDSEFKADEIQMLTYSLCHGYSRCTRAVSIPAPTYYAHLAAYRVRCQIEAMPPSNYSDIKKLNELVKRDSSLTENFPMHFI